MIVRYKSVTAWRLLQAALTVTCVALLVAPAKSEAFVTGHQSTHWPAATCTLTVNTVNFSDGSIERSAIDAGAWSWRREFVPGTTFTVETVSGTGTGNVPDDGKNLIFYDSNISVEKLAVTTLTFDGSTWLDADIGVNPYYRFPPSGTPQFVFYPGDEDPSPPYENYEFESLIRHEVGHAVGFDGTDPNSDLDDHETQRLAVMNFAYSYGSWHRPGLHADDRNGLRTLYSGTGTEADLALTGWTYSTASLTGYPLPVPTPQTVGVGDLVNVNCTVENLGTQGGLRSKGV